MKKFNFKLEKLLVIKEYIELEAKLKYASVLQKKLALENENNMIEKSVLENIVNEYKSKKPGDRLDADMLNQEGDFATSCLTKISINNLQKEKIEVELEKLLIDLQKATKEKKTMEKLKENELLKYKKQANRYEQKRLDETAGQLFERNKVKELL